MVALDRHDGRTLWEFDYQAPVWPDFAAATGTGPHASPLVVGDRIFTVGFRGQLHALDRQGGKTWSHDLWKEFGGEPRVRGYSCSPIAYGETLILPVGGSEGRAVMAFGLADGSVAWGSGDSKNGYSSPLLINVDGQGQVVVVMATHVLGLDPASGQELWRHPHRNTYGVNASMPLWGPDNTLFISSAYDSGSRVLQLSRKGDSSSVKELWFTKRIKLHHGNAVLLGGTIYASSGDFGPAFMMGVNPISGEFSFRQRGFAKSNLLGVGEHLIILDAGGQLALGRPAGDRLVIHSQAQVLFSRSWTVPTLVGTKLYLRDIKEIVALELGR